MPSSGSLFTALESSLESATGEVATISAHSGLELAKEATIQDSYFIKIVNSRPDIYTGQHIAENEIFALEIMTFVKTTDSFSDKLNKYQKMLSMSDKVKSWAVSATHTAYADWVKYLGISRVDDDKQGFYAIIQRIEFETTIPLG